MFDRVHYWLKGDKVQNFGDSLTKIFLERLFLPVSATDGVVHLVGSCIDDWWFRLGVEAYPQTTPAFWGCGIRGYSSLSAENRRRVSIHAVRGPISARDLGLDDNIPLGDSALVLPALYIPRVLKEFQGKSVCIPHFHDVRDGANLRERSKCDVVIRSNVGPEKSDLYRTIDVIASAEFVLSASLHGAIIAAAYKRPFAFWDSGIPADVPLKWEDFAASCNFSARFTSNATLGRKIFDDEILPFLTLPKIAPLAKSAPLALQPKAYLKLLRYDLLSDLNVPAERLASDLTDNLILATSRAAEDQVIKLSEQLRVERLRVDRMINADCKRSEALLKAIDERRQKENAIARLMRRKRQKKDRAIIQKSGLFDEKWYRMAYEDIGNRPLNALHHYVSYGCYEGRDPNSDFDTSFYLLNNPDVVVAEMNPLVHYIKFGKNEGRLSKPLN